MTVDSDNPVSTKCKFLVSLRGVGDSDFAGGERSLIVL